MHLVTIFYSLSFGLLNYLFCHGDHNLTNFVNFGIGASFGYIFCAILLNYISAKILMLPFLVLSNCVIGGVVGFYTSLYFTSWIDIFDSLPLKILILYIASFGTMFGILGGLITGVLCSFSAVIYAKIFSK